MARLFCLFLLAVSLTVEVTCVDPVWDYDDDGDHGPSHWHDDYEHCDDDDQSPIDIDTHHVEKEEYKKFSFTHYGETDGVHMTLTNNGHSAQLSLTGSTLKISGGGLHGDYDFEQLHFHWGADDTEGSEHTIDDHHYPLEMHVVHYSEDYADLESALDHDDGLAVLAFLFEISSEDNHDLDHLIDALDDIHDEDDEHAVTDFSIESLIAPAIGSFYRYHGSLTTPGCEESVIWTIFKHTIKISHAQLDEFRHLTDHDSAEIEHNFRPVQDLHDRTVHYYREEDSGAEANSAALALIMAAWLVTFMQ